MKRILYFTGYRMVAQEWAGRKLNSSVYFEPDEQGLDLFEAYLVSLKSEPIKLLIDLIEEEFRQVTIPLLSGTDRQAIIDRNYAKFFRNSQYKNAVSQAVIKKDRKQESLLVSGLTNQSLLKPWLDIVEKTSTPLSGILTLPLMSEEITKSFKSESDCVILVSQQVPSNLRQSVFIKGKLVLSRLVPIASFYQGDYASDVMRDIESTQRYLSSQRLIDRADVISIHILCNKRHYEKLTDKTSDDNYFDYHIYDINQLIKKEKIEVSDEQDFSSVLFCFEATRKTFSNHYARKIEKKYFYHYLSSLVLKMSSIVLLTIGLGLLSISVVKGKLYDLSVDEMSLLEQKYNSKYNQLNEQKQDSSISTTNMRSVVKTVQQINDKYQHSPRKMMIEVSQDIALFSDMRLNKLDWFVADSASAGDASKQQKSKATRGNRNRRSGSAKSGKGLFEVMTINGELLNFDGDYRYALSVIDDLEASLNVGNKYYSVTVTQRPLNIQSNESISGDVSLRLNRKTSSGKALFALKIVKEVNLNDK